MSSLSFVVPARGRLPLARVCLGAPVENDPLELVDIKTDGANLNTYEMLLPYSESIREDVWEQLRTVHPAAVVDALESLYAKERA